MKRKLLPEYRTRMRELVGGFIQHCEISKNLAGSIDLFVESQGHKYGLPVFTFYGPPRRDLDSRFVGLLARNDGADKRPAEALLQLLERLALQPDLASGLVLSAMPVTDPIALESDEVAHSPELARSIETSLESFAARALDGLVELSISPRNQPTVDVEGPSYVREAAVQASETIDRLGRESAHKGFDTRLSLRAATDADYWNIRIGIPASWSEPLVTHWVSQFLVIFLRARIEILLRSEAHANEADETLLQFPRGKRHHSAWAYEGRED